MDDQKKYAVLIDAENIAYKYVKYIMGEMANYGVVTYKRAYMDWSAQNATGWKGVLLENAISPVQSIAYTSGKNSTDSTIIIDAMDILYSKTVDGFCIVSSDSDFTKLATRLRESGMTVIGMGESKTPKPLVEACNHFKVLNLIAMDGTVKDSENKNAKGVTKNQEVEVIEKRTVTLISEIEETIKKIIENNEDKGQDVEIGEIGKILNNRYSEFDTRNYGYSKLSVMIKDMDFLEILESDNRIFVKLKVSNKIDDIEKKIVQIIAENGGSVSLSNLAQLIKAKYFNFNPKDYGYSQFKKMIESISEINISKDNAELVNELGERAYNNEDNKNKKEELNKAIIKILKENNGIMNLGQINEKLLNNDKNFKPKKYGYSKFSKLLEDISQVKIENNNARLIEKDETEKKKIEQVIINVIEKNGGKIKIGSIKNELRKDYPNFDQKNYGYSKFSKFIESIESIDLNGQDAILDTNGSINIINKDELSEITTDNLNSDVIKEKLNEEKDSVDSSSVNIDNNEIEKEIIKILEYNKGKVEVRKIKNTLMKKYTNFPQRRYGFSRFCEYLSKISNIKIQDEEAILIKKSNCQAKKTDIAEIRECISNILSQNNNVMNIGLIKQNLMKIYPDFNLQDYDCSSFKVFLESMEGFKIIENNANID